VLYNLRDGQYEVVEESFTGFLVGVFSGAVKSSLLPEDFPGETGVKFGPISYAVAG
jgi:hypothetical protein